MTNSKSGSFTMTIFGRQKMTGSTMDAITRAESDQANSHPVVATEPLASSCSMAWSSWGTAGGGSFTMP
jgi:hypothetical protein